jgi:Fe-Mn family superoxide dismutase
MKKNVKVHTMPAAAPLPSPFVARTFPAARALDGISDAQIDEHLELYEGYVKAVNALEHAVRDLAGAGRTDDPEWSELQRRLGFETNGMRLHELYFDALRPGGVTIEPGLGDAIVQDFGSFDAWREEFVAIGMMRGIGWAVLAQDPATGRLANHRIDLHEQGVPVGARPVVAMDMWEHAFLRDYKSHEKSHYVDAFLRNLDWPTCAARIG